MDDHHLSAVLKYIELNPVRAGICKKASEYTWSSCRFYLGLEPKNILIKDRNWFATPREWEKLLKNNPKEIELLRKHFRTGRPLGDEGFLIEAEKITGRELIP